MTELAQAVSPDGLSSSCKASLNLLADVALHDYPFRKRRRESYESMLVAVQGEDSQFPQAAVTNDPGVPSIPNVVPNYIASSLDLEQHRQWPGVPKDLWEGTLVKPQSSSSFDAEYSRYHAEYSRFVPHPTIFSYGGYVPPQTSAHEPVCDSSPLPHHTLSYNTTNCLRNSGFHSKPRSSDSSVVGERLHSSVVEPGFQEWHNPSLIYQQQISPHDNKGFEPEDLEPNHHKPNSKRYQYPGLTGGQSELVSVVKYMCSYCGAIKKSASTGNDGRIRIRCECGGKYQDNTPRMHAMWNRVEDDDNEPSPRKFRRKPVSS